MVILEMADFLDGALRFAMFFRNGRYDKEAILNSTPTGTGKYLKTGRLLL